MSNSIINIIHNNIMIYTVYVCVLFVHIYCLPLIVVIYLQFGSRPAELEVPIRFSLENNREYILDNLNIMRGV